ncbi:MULTISPECIES: MdtA/MuxA family multidrug efflux RND transporter periplasmic adaptor subunit [Legionella]|uniref:Multidrug efflux system, subunit A n=1 Tax=Legionella maceachernii TaxID=466 RepID=A0A0W0VVY5_9GAMM|nr:MdtA/MuxA family multidrug efflux RND transporter periplasmic adaptor subunit [Legionella maceachernii]KTD24216.1 multidrug efflux system, subunit A [Legionella maceachernii]SJZ89354.1 membrane fusion protein, multidrug efflux system [Legionella maceachernii]SUO98768.1 Multidrug resistance protein MdtE precursor [Legionella maceachernii]
MNEPLSPDDQRPPDPLAESESSHRSSMLWWLLLLGAVLALVYFIKYRHTKPEEEKKPPAVTLAVARTSNVPVYISALGNVTATYTVTVKTQINGLLMKVLFKEGQFVKKGQLLAEIDQRPLLAQLTQYQGQLLRDQALLANALVDLKRYQRLWKQDSVSQQTLATQESLVKQYQGEIEIDQGLIESTKINLLYCHITSPIDGRIGLRLVDPGNFVQTTDQTGIAVITTLNPITVIFTIPEDDVARILPQAFTAKNIEVEAYDRQQKQLLATGTLLTIDNQIDTTTGTVRLRAIFDNKESRLFPNQFVNAKLLVTTLNNAIVVPTAAILHGNNGNFVYRLNSDFTVRVQPIKPGVTHGDETVIQQGLSFGEQVVVDGADKLNDGMKVSIAGSSSKLME